MKKLSKNIAASRALVKADKFYPLAEAIKLAKKASYAKFDATIDIVFKLNLDTRQADQQLRGALALPNGTGKSVKVLVATDDVAAQKAAKTAGAEIVVGAQELQDILKKGKFNFDIIVTDPKMMPTLGRFGKELGPKGLMPNPKTGTVTPNVAKAVKEIKKGKANYRTDKNGNVHTIIGKKSMTDKALLDNAEAVIDLIKKLKPSAVKGTYIEKLSVSASMGASVKVLLEK